MKKNFLKITLLFCLASLSCQTTYAQNDGRKNEIRIKVEKEIDGKKIIEERIIDTSGMSEEERQEALDKTQKELIGKDFANKRVKISVENYSSHSSQDNDDKDTRFEWRSDDEPEIFFNDSTDQQVRVYRYKDAKSPKIIIKKRGSDHNDFDWDSEEWEYNFERGMNNLNNRLRYLGDEIPRRIGQNTPIYRWDNQLFGSNAAPIKSVEVYPNRPDSHIVNVRFFAPDEGDISIKVLDINGKIVAEEKEANFKGEYVGQLALRKGSKGTYFVIISQEDDGVSKRIILE